MKRILLIGNGNVAFHLKKAFIIAGYTVYKNTDDGDFDLAIFSISDDAYAQVIQSFPIENKMMVHTSGSIPASVFAGKTDSFGVIYPYQTINKNDETINFRNIPLLLTASSSESQQILTNIAKTLSDTVKIITDEQRLKLHLAAVFANNFTNHMIAIAQKLAQENDLDTSLLLPLLEKTFLRLKSKPAAILQTGPAIRGDSKVIEKHLKLLENHPEWQKIYSFVSENIKESK